MQTSARPGRSGRHRLRVRARRFRARFARRCSTRWSAPGCGCCCPSPATTTRARRCRCTGASTAPASWSGRAFGLREPPPPWLPADAIARGRRWSGSCAGRRPPRRPARPGRGLLRPVAAAGATPTARLIAVVRDDELVDRAPRRAARRADDARADPGGSGSSTRSAIVGLDSRPSTSGHRRASPSPTPTARRPIFTSTWRATNSQRNAALGGSQLGGVAKGLVEVGLRADREQVARIVGEVAATLVVPVARALVPGVGQRHDVIDLHGTRT